MQSQNHQSLESDSNLASLKSPHHTSSEKGVTRRRRKKNSAGRANVSKVVYTRRPPRPITSFPETCFLARSSSTKQM
ncbi:hypothetical protein SESBI_42493 [Sesbania bispinosa]|nr:hypothetical protein SESBI_42493 [Sesbania bispinosa]